MARKDPMLLAPVPSVREDRSFTDPRTGEVYEFTFDVQEGLPQQYFLDETNRTLESVYLTGIEKVRNPRGGFIRFSKALISNIAFFMSVDQTQDDSGGAWSFEHWAGLSVQCPDVFVAVTQWAVELRNKALGVPIDTAELPDEASDLGNVSTAGAA